MADYFTQFSCIFDLGTPENARRALALFEDFALDLEREDEGHPRFALSINEQDGAALWIHDDDGSGNPEHVIAFVLRCAKALGLKGRWGFEWANTCGKPRLDGFGGGAHVLDLEKGATIAWVCTNDWLHRHLTADADERE